MITFLALYYLLFKKIEVFDGNVMPGSWGGSDG